MQVGDWVLSRNEHDPDGPVRAKRVVRTFVFRGPVVVLHANTRLIETTPEHPFFVEGKGWQTALELQPGDRLTTSTEETVICSGCALSGRVEAVYNVEVEEDHTYFIGENDWGWDLWAHNATAGRGGSPTPSVEAPKGVSITSDLASKAGGKTRPELIADLEKAGLKLKGTGSPDGRFMEFVDDAGRVRAKIHPPDKATPTHHLHLYDEAGNPLDVALNPVLPTSPAAHIPIKAP